MKKIISVTINENDLAEFNGMLDEKMISRSRIFEKLMCEQIEKWKQENME